jgi:hypothetical protein
MSKKGKGMYVWFVCEVLDLLWKGHSIVSHNCQHFPELQFQILPSDG